MNSLRSTLRFHARPSAYRCTPRAVRQSLHTAQTPLLRRPQLWPATLRPRILPVRAALRHKSTDAESAPRPGVLTDRPDHPPEDESYKREEAPSYEMTFTCKPCTTRSTHRVTKQGYHFGTVLISCPGCKARHLIADHLKIFSDTSITIEQLMEQKGQMVKRGSLSEGGDLEFWEDGTQTPRTPPAPKKQ